MEWRGAAKQHALKTLGQRSASQRYAVTGGIDIGQRSRERHTEVRRQAIARATRHRYTALEQVIRHIRVAHKRPALGRALAEPACARHINVERAVGERDAKTVDGSQSWRSHVASRLKLGAAADDDIHRAIERGHRSGLAH